jgi:outer membrane protein
MEKILMRLKILLFTILFTAFLSFGQTTIKRINLEKAISMALERNISVLQSKNSIETQKSGYKSAIGGLLPTLNADGSFSRRQTAVNKSNHFSAGNDYSAGVSSNLTLFDGFANIANINLSSSSISASESNYKRIQQSTIYQAHLLFLSLVKNFQIMKVNEENLKRDKQQLERIEETNKVGAASLADVYRQRATTSRDEYLLINAQNNYNSAKNSLALFLSLNTTENYEFDFSDVPSDIDTSEFSVINQQYQNLDELASKAMETRSDYLSAVQNLNISDASLTIARSGVYPTVNATASYGIGAAEFNRMSDNRDFTLGVGVSLPILSGFRTQAAIEKAKISKMDAENQLKQTERQVRVDIDQARLDLESAEKQIKVTQTGVLSAEMDRKIAEEKYNLGAGTLLDLLTASANYVDAQSNKVDAVTSYLLARKQMEFVLGTISK